MVRYYLKYKLLIFISLASITIAIAISYSNSFSGEFLHWDDREYVLYNDHVHHINLENLEWMIVSYRQSNWHPLTWLSHSIDYTLWGGNPFGHHLSSIMLHIANSFIIFFICVLLLDKINSQKAESDDNNIKYNLLAAASISLLFAVHPLHVESVTWIAERKDVLYSFFYLFSVTFYLLYLRSTNPTFKLLTLLCFVFSIMSKSMAISLPFVLIILDFYPFNRFHQNNLNTRIVCLFKEKASFFVIMLTVMIITLVTQSMQGSVASLEQFPLIERLQNAANSFLIYPLQLIAPYHLSPFYPYPEYIRTHTPEGWLPVLCCLIIFAIGIYLAYYKNSKSPLAVLMLYSFMVAPVIGIVQVGIQAHADRYTYLTTLPILFYLVTGFYRFILRENVNKDFAAVIILITSIPLGYKTHTQINYWQTDRTLWSRVITLYPNRSANAYQNLGNSYETTGDYQTAEHFYNIAKKLDPNNLNNLTNLLVIYEKTGRATQARTQWLDLMKKHSDTPWLWIKFGDFNLRQHDQNAALKAYEMAIRTSGFSPDIKQALDKRGLRLKDNKN